MNDDLPITIVLQYDQNELWSIYWRTYFTFSNIWMFTVGSSVYGIFLSTLFLGRNIYFFHILTSISLAILFAVAFFLVSTALGVSQKKEATHYRFAFMSDVIEVGSADMDESAPWACTLAWKYFSKIVERKAGFLLYRSGRIQYLVPMRCFADNFQIEDFRRLLRSVSDDVQVRLRGDR